MPLRSKSNQEHTRNRFTGRARPASELSCSRWKHPGGFNRSQENLRASNHSKRAPESVLENMLVEKAAKKYISTVLVKDFSNAVFPGMKHKGGNTPC